MGIPLVIARLAALGVLALLVQGADIATGGEVYMATVTRLAQTTLPELQMMPPPPETSPIPSQPLPPPPPPGEPQPGQYTQPQNGQFPGMPPGGLPQGQPFQKGQFEPPKGGFAEPFEEGEDKEEFLDPRMVSDVIRQIRDMKRQAAPLVKQAQKANDNASIEQLNKIIAEVNGLLGIISGSASNADKRDAIQEFHENNLWDDVNRIRRKLQFPAQIKQFTTSLNRLKKIIAAKTNQNLGLDMASVRSKIGEMESNLAGIKQFVAEGNLEDADELMQEFHQGTNPNEIENVIMRVRNDLNRMAKSTKNQDILARIEELRQKVIAAFNAVEYREANELMNEEMPAISRLFQQLQQSGRLRK